MTRPSNISSEILESLALRVTMPAAMSSRASVSRVARVFEGETASTVWICRRTRALRSSMGIRNGSSLNRGRTCTCSVRQGLSLSVIPTLDALE